jgi:3-methyladenine DNA glycosylase AlkD
MNKVRTKVTQPLIERPAPPVITEEVCKFNPRNILSMAITRESQLKYTSKEFLSELAPMQAEFHLTGNSKSGEPSSYDIPMADIFSLAKKYIAMPLQEVKTLLGSKYHEVRVGAVSIMDFKARDKKVSPSTKKELYELYINNHNKINNWDLVDRSAPYVVGGYLFDKSRAPLYKLAKSKNVWERRTAIVATYFFIRQNEIDDTFKIAELLVYDKEHFVNTAVGSWIREAGKRDEKRLVDFINKHFEKMPRVTLRYAVEKLDKKIREAYLKR